MPQALIQSLAVKLYGEEDASSALIPLQFDEQILKTMTNVNEMEAYLRSIENLMEFQTFDEMVNSNASQSQRKLLNLERFGLLPQNIQDNVNAEREIGNFPMPLRKNR